MASNFTNAAVRSVMDVKSLMASTFTNQELDNVVFATDFGTYRAVLSGSTVEFQRLADATGANRDSYITVTSDAEEVRLLDWLATNSSGVTDFEAFIEEELEAVVGVEVFSLAPVTSGAEQSDVIRVSGSVYDHFGAVPTDKGPFTLWCIVQASDDTALDATEFSAATATTGTVENHSGNIIVIETNDNGSFNFDLTDEAGGSEEEVLLTFMIVDVPNDGEAVTRTVTFDAV